MIKQITSRSYQGDEDLRAMTDLLDELRKKGQIVYPVGTDLFEDLTTPEAQSTSRLWLGNTQHLLGFCYISRYQNLVDVFDADFFTRDLENEMMNWVVNAALQRDAKSGELNTLDASAREDDADRLAFLLRNGFEQLPETTILMARSLDIPIPEPVLPPGFIIRSLAGESELEAVAALHRAAFGTEVMTVDYRRAMISAPGYIPELDLVAVAPSGELAAYCMCQVFPGDAPRASGTREGWTDPIATHPGYQRKGLAKALMLKGMRLLKEYGIDTVLLGTSSTNQAMRLTAEAVGFKVVSNTLWFSKKIH